MDHLICLFVVTACLLNPFPVDAERFSKVGDSITHSHEYLYPLGEGNYNLGQWAGFSDEVVRYQASFTRESLAAYPGWTSFDSVRTIGSEYDAWDPQIAFIMIGTNDSPLWVDSGQYESNLREIVRYTLSRNIQPVLFTIPPRGGRDVKPYNDIVWRTATEYHVPVIDYYSGMLGLVNWGLREDMVHPSVPQDGKVAFFDPEHLYYGYNLRNFLTVFYLDH